MTRPDVGTSFSAEEPGIAQQEKSSQVNFNDVIGVSRRAAQLQVVSTFSRSFLLNAGCSVHFSLSRHSGPSLDARRKEQRGVA
jgi:hypothetical protein